MGKVTENILNEITQIIIVLSKANIWTTQAWVTSVSQYDGVFCIQTNTLTEIIIAGYFLSGWKASKSSKGSKTFKCQDPR